MDYIKNQYDNAAMNHLVPCCQKMPPHLFIIGKKMFDLLEKIDGNLNCLHTLINKFSKLQIKNKDFNTFWVGFLHFLADLDYEDATFIFKLTYKLMPQLQHQLTIGDSQLIDLYKYAKQC